MSLDYRKVAIYSVVLLALLLSLAACNSNKPPEVPPFKTFATSEDAGDQLFQAAKSGEQDAVLAIFGAPSKDVLLSGDPVQDKAALNAFVSGYGVMHRWRKMPDGSQILLVGADNFPFPIPLEKNAGGLWYFDTAAGKDEILRRRIGRNELAVIDVCGALAQAQAQYFSQVHADGSSRQYALKFISDPGKQNGLYWESQQGQPASPLGPLAAFATQEGYSAKQNAHQPFHGYYFHMLNRQGAQAPGGAKDYVVGGKMVSGFAFVAYPAEYGNSGVMTFMLNKDGVLLQKDLGKNTADIASAMSEFNPDASWTVVQD
jgi:predicted small lipoprotein YifL